MKTNGKRRPRDPATSLRDQTDVSRLPPSETFQSGGKVARLTETLLVVSDDPAVTEILSRQGYKVRQARSAEEGLRLARETVVIHLLITDFSTPQLDGLELSHRFRSVHPRTPVLILSGSLPLLRDGTRDLAHVVLLAKPFAPNELLDNVRMLLDAVVAGGRKPWAHD